MRTGGTPIYGTPICAAQPPREQAVHHHETLSGQRGRRVDPRVQDELRRDQGMGRNPQGFALVEWVGLVETNPYLWRILAFDL